jgi:hypothetical protein
MAAKKGLNVLFCMPSRTNCILLISVMIVQGGGKRPAPGDSESVGRRGQTSGQSTFKAFEDGDDVSTAEESEEEDDSLCYICCDSRATAVLLECGHGELHC